MGSTSDGKAYVISGNWDPTDPIFQILNTETTKGNEGSRVKNNRELKCLLDDILRIDFNTLRHMVKSFTIFNKLVIDLFPILLLFPSFSEIYTK